MKGLRAAIVNAIGPMFVRRSPALVFKICLGKGTGLDPEAQALVRKVALAGRMFAKHLEAEDKSKKGISLHAKRKMIGTGREGQKQDARVKPLGPIGFPSEGTDQCDASLDDNLYIRQGSDVDLHMDTTPWAIVHELTESMATRKRTQDTSRRRE